MRHRLFQAKRYFQHRLAAVNRHGVHSPFVYRMVHEVLRAPADKKEGPLLAALRQSLHRSSAFVQVTDLGAGSHRLRSPRRRIASVARTALKPPERAMLLARLARYVQASSILELGTSLGLTTLHLALARPAARVFSIEGCPATRHLAVQHFQQAGTSNILSLEGAFRDRLPEVLEQAPVIDLTFIDGHHTGEATKDYFQRVLPHVPAHGVVVLDDIHWSPDMEAAWDHIRMLPSVTVSIDLYDIGLLFFHPGQAKEHFRLRY